MGGYKDLISRTLSLGCESSVELPGYSSEIEREMGEASIYAMTSRFEGFGLVLVEAQKMGLPIISYDLPYGPSEIVNEGEDGYLVDYNDKDDFAKKLLELIENEELRQSMSAKAQINGHRFDQEVIGAQWMEKYNQLIHRN